MYGEMLKTTVNPVALFLNQSSIRQVFIEEEIKEISYCHRYFIPYNNCIGYIQVDKAQ